MPHARPAEPSWHALPPEQAIAALHTHAGLGLDAADAARRLTEHGANHLPRAAADGPLRVLWSQINNPLIWVLLASGGLAMAVDPTDGVKNGLVIVCVVVLNTTIGFVQEVQAGRAIDALSAMVPLTTTVVRDGVRQTIDAALLVPGDVITLASGDRVPADGRLVDQRTLRIEEATLTGESVPAEKSVAPLPWTQGSATA